MKATPVALVSPVLPNTIACTLTAVPTPRRCCAAGDKRPRARLCQLSNTANGAPELFVDVLREGLAELLLDELLVLLDEGAQSSASSSVSSSIALSACTVRAPARRGRRASMPKHDVRIHLDEAAVGRRRSGGRRLGGPAPRRLVVQAEVEDGVHHARHRLTRAPERTDTSSGLCVSPKRAPTASPTNSSAASTCFLEACRKLVIVREISGADIRGDRKAGGHGQARGTPFQPDWRLFHPIGRACRSGHRPCPRQNDKRAWFRHGAAVWRWPSRRDRVHDLHFLLRVVARINRVL